MRRHADAAEGVQQVLERIGDVERGGGQGEQAHPQQQQQQAAGEAPQAGQSPPSLWNEGGQQGEGGHHEF